MDAALLEIDDTDAGDGHRWRVPESLTDLHTRPSQRFGHLIGSRPHPVTAAGFPRMQKDSASGLRLDEQLPGHIVPGTGRLARRYEFSTVHPVLTPPPSVKSSRWAGMSGAAVLGAGAEDGDVLCGVIRQDRQADGGSRLTATPAALLVADNGFTALVSRHTGWKPVLEPVETAALFTPASPLRLLYSPAALLRADAEAVTFEGRGDELTELSDWCRGGPSAPTVAVLTGPGGQGKSRLARRLADTLGQEGWVTGHLRSDFTDLDAPPAFSPLDTALPLLIVVDYAETRPRLLRRLLSHLQRSRHRVRVLLIARSDGPWRTDALGATAAVRMLLTTARLAPLAPLLPRGLPKQDRSDAFGRAVKDFARLLPHIPNIPPFDWGSLAGTLECPYDLSLPRFDTVLALQLTALVLLLENGPAPAARNLDMPAEDILLQHEERLWQDSAHAPSFRLELPTPLLAAAVAVAVLCGAAAQEDAVRVVATIPGLPDGIAPRTAAWLTSLYPAGPDRFWGSLQPDPIAEYHASRLLLSGAVNMTGLLTAAAPAQQAQVITVLARSAIAHSNAGRSADGKAVIVAVHTAVSDAGVTSEAARTALTALLVRSRVIGPLALRLAEQVVRADEERATKAPDEFDLVHANSLGALAVWLTVAGRYAEATRAAESSVRVYRRLAEQDADLHQVPLAGVLSIAGMTLARQGRTGQALEYERQAVTILRRAGKDGAHSHDPSLATSLSNMGSFLGSSKQWVEALAADEEAVAIRRRLTRDNPTAHEHALAFSLCSLSSHLAALGRRAEALFSAQEGEGRYRRLARINPDAHEAGLATTLITLSTRLAESDQHTQALAPAAEAVDIRRRLARSDPAPYEPELAASLTNLSIRLSEAAREDDALAASEEAVTILTELAQGDTGRHQGPLTTALLILRTRLAAVGRHAEALHLAEATVQLNRRAVSEDFVAHEPHLASSLFGLALLASALQLRARARVAVEEAISVLRRLIQLDGPLHRQPLADALALLAVIRTNSGEPSAALRAAGEAVDLYRAEATTTPLALPPLHTALGLQARLLDQLGRREDASRIRRWLTSNPLPQQ
ncbi:tetratricopeptide repeat protein [Streptomyces sp. CRN 30]|uniref:tetratricopeptide repeat protein n=1 Tax=Streptomyces sp. CRN 30 TaxID=3075613 RepID=UPI002A7F3950|nr:tetratricopeptide repeat protein [Streptomyces sp. CRN 30]